MNRWALAAFALAALLSTHEPAGAADCVPSLRILNSVQMQTTPDHTVMVVPITIDGSNRKLLLDTGGPVTQISRATAKALELPERPSSHRLFDLAGNVSETQTTARRIILGLKEQRGVKLNIAPNPELGTSLPYDGLLATDLFVDADLDLDFGAGRLTAFSTDHCEGRVVYWPAENIAVVPITVKQRLITLPITVDGQTMTAVMDTGAQYSVMNMALATRLFGLTPDSPDMQPLTENSGEWTITAYGHRFDTLTFEGVTVKNLRIYLMPDQMASHDRLRHRELPDPWGLRLHRETSGDVGLPDMILGMDVLRHLHVYFATKEERLYITDAIRGESALFRYKDR
jgi:predicted aspartyl protease